METTSKPFKILCIDGGGIKGLYSAVILEKLESKFKTNLSDKFDLICGTSTGGILALAIALKIPMSEAVNLYRQDGPKIFNERIKKIPFGKYFLLAKQALYHGKYDNKALKKALRNVYGARTMADCNNLICIPAFNVSTGKPRVFKRDYGDLGRDNNLKCVDVALATAAAPTYFPIYELENLQYADGGLWANNPTMVGLTEFLFKISKLENLNYDEVQILSISSFVTPKGQPHKKLKRSFWDWKDSIFDTFPAGQADFENCLLKELIPHLDFKIKYERIENEKLHSDYAKLLALDNASDRALKELEGIATQTVSEAVVRQEIKDFFSTNKTFKVL